MKIFKYFLELLADALFPLTSQEKILESMSPDRAWQTFTKAPPTPVSDTIAVFAYKDKVVSRMIWSIKYRKNPHCIRIGAFALCETISANFGPKVVIIPMPMSHRRRLERGYNQTELLASALSGEARPRGLEYQVRADLLEKVIHNSRQTLKSKDERIESAAGLFRVTKNIADIDRDSLLVVIDDVITTGSTIQEAMQTLRSAGFTNVRGVSIAH
jgi:ComF family protein